MPVAYVDSTASGASDTQSESNSVAVPTGSAAGHIVVLLGEIWLDNGVNPNVTYPSGFTQIVNLADSVNHQKLKGAWKRLSGAESTPYAVNWTGQGSQWNMWHAIMFSGALESGDPVDFVDTDNTSTTGTSLPVMSGVAAGADFVVDAIANENNSSGTPSTNYTEAEDGSYLKTNYRVLSGAGTETTSGGSLSVSTLKLRALIGFKPASSGATDLVIQDATVGVSSDTPTLTRIIDLAIQKATLALTSDAPNLTLATNITIHKAFLTPVVDSPSITQVHNVQVQDATLSVKSDTISLVPPGTGGFMSVSDVQMQKLTVLTGKSGSIQDLMHAYYSSLSGLVPAASFSVADHQRAYWEAQTGLTGRSLADLERAFYDLMAIAAGSLADREFTYWVAV